MEDGEGEEPHAMTNRVVAMSFFMRRCYRACDNFASATARDTRAACGRIAAMARAHTEWKAHDHTPIQKLSERVWRVEGSVPKLPLRRVMTIIKRADGGLIVHNGVAVRDAELAEIQAWGEVKAIIVPNAYHRLDARVFKDRFPNAQVIAPSGARTKVEQVVPVDLTYDQVAADAHVELVHLDGTKQREGAMIARDVGGATLVFNDGLFNMPHVPGFQGFVLKNITGSTGGPRVSNLMRWFVIADKRAYRAHLERLADTPDLRRIVVSHHETIENDPAGALRRAAATL